MKTEYGGLLYGIAAGIFLKSILFPDAGKIAYFLAVVFGGGIGYFGQNYLRNRPKKQ